VATVDSPPNDGDTVVGVTANLRSTSVWRDGLRFWAGIFTFGSLYDVGEQVATSR